jgi:glycosyltransferase involved in cell wall biosynthesis
MPVSVIIPAHNAARSIASALSSLSSAAEIIVEILVIDDASTDDTGAVAARVGTELGLPVRVVTANVRDPGQARNVGIEQAAAPLIYFLDADDRHCIGGLRRLFEAAIRSPQTGLIVGAYQRLTDGVRLAVTPVGRYRSSGAANAARYLTGKIRPIVMGSALVTRAAIGDLRFPEHLPYDEDTLFWAAILRHSSVTAIDDFVMVYQESAQRSRDRLTTEPAARFLIWRQALNKLVQMGIDHRTLATREGLIAMMIAKHNCSLGDYDTAARFLTLARAAPASAPQMLRRHYHALKIATRRLTAGLKSAERIRS